jgi:Arc/MetJ-type ribon-helix-helix transcriptional regulator
MRRTINISVSEELYSYISRQVGPFRFASVSEYIRLLVRADRVQQAERAKETPPERITLRRAKDVSRDIMIADELERLQRLLVR